MSVLKLNPCLCNVILYDLTGYSHIMHEPHLLSFCTWLPQKFHLCKQLVILKEISQYRLHVLVHQSVTKYKLWAVSVSHSLIHCVMLAKKSR